MKNKAKKTAFLGVMTAIAMVLSYLEAVLPPLYSAVPGIKIGLPNVVIIFILYRFSFKEASAVSFVRVFLTALLFGNAMTLAYSTSGAVLSIVLMALAKKTEKFSAIGVSVVGGVTHNLGQILMAIILLNSTQIAYYMLVLLVTGTIAGVFIGLAGSALIKKFPKALAINYYDINSKENGL